jgi:peptidoglycan/xylan/chitin deacetylase (PgdA/CDA1 family)
MRDVAAAIAATVSAILFGSMLAEAAECPGNPNALGTSRTLVVDPIEHPRLGTIQYHETLPLEDHEIVITFDDGPLPPRSTRVLETLDHECVKATFFLIGKMAHTFPDWVRRIRNAGHTIGTHSYSHPLTFRKMPLDKAEFEINEGIAQVTAALGDGGGLAPFFRIPGLLRAHGVEHYLASQHIQVWSADEVADDWLKIDSGQVYSRALQRIEANHKGILLLHDIQPRTVEALPYLLRELKRRGYRVVHVVPASSESPKTATDPDQWVMHARLTPRAPILFETEPGLPVASPASFGLEVAFDSITFLHGVATAHDPTWQPRPIATQVPEPLQLLTDSSWPRGFAMKPPVPGWLGRLSSRTTRTSINTVADPAAPVAVDEIQRLLEALPEEQIDSNRDRKNSLAEDAAAAASQSWRGPVVNTVLPNGPFP